MFYFKVSKAVVLQKSIDYLQYLSQQKKKQESELVTLRKVCVLIVQLKNIFIKTKIRNVLINLETK